MTESEAETEWTLALRVPVSSRSETVRVPVEERVASVSVSELAAELAFPVPTEMSGVSLAPVMVTVTSWLRTLISLLLEAEVKPESSVTVMR